MPKTPAAKARRNADNAKRRARWKRGGPQVEILQPGCALPYVIPAHEYERYKQDYPPGTQVKLITP